MELTTDYKFDLKTNMAELKNEIEADVKKYDVIVTEASVKDTKKVMADINKMKKEFKITCKEFLDAITKPIAEFKEAQKEIEALYDDGRSKLDVQVKRFEQGILDNAKDLLTEYTAEICKEKKLNPALIQFDDLILLGTVAASGKLSSGARDKIDQRVLIIEAEILKAQLEAEEKAKRDRAIAEEARLKAEERAKQREIDTRLEAERKQKETEARVEQAKKDAAEAEKRAEELAKQAKIPEKKESADKKKKIINIRIDFAVEIGVDVPNQAIIDRLFSVLPDTIKSKNPKIYIV